MIMTTNHIEGEAVVVEEAEADALLLLLLVCLAT